MTLQCMLYYYVCDSAPLPLNLPSKYGFVATLRPGCGNKKQLMLEKQE